MHMQGDAHIDAAWNSTAIRTARIAEHVADMIPSATVLVVGLLPRGDVTLHPTPDAFKLPSKSVLVFASKSCFGQHFPDLVLLARCAPRCGIMTRAWSHELQLPAAVMAPPAPLTLGPQLQDSLWPHSLGTEDPR